MDIDILKTFCLVAGHKSYQKASEILHITQPSVTRRIQRLEAEIGKVLLIRTSKSITLTKQGKDFLPFAERVIRIVQEGMKKVYETTDEKLLIAGSQTTCFNLLPKIIKEFSLTNHTPVSILTATADQIFDSLIDQTIDIGFTYDINDITQNPMLVFETIHTEEVICVGNPDLIRKHLTADHIITYPIPLVLNTFQHPRWKLLYKTFKEESLIESIFETNSFRVSEKLARTGTAFSLLPISDAQEGLDTGELIRVFLPNVEVPERVVYIVTAKNRTMKNSILEFKKIAKTMLSTEASE